MLKPKKPYKILIFIAFIICTLNGSQGSFAAEKVPEGDSVKVYDDASKPQNDSIRNTPYRLGPDDKVDITVFGERDLTGSYTISNVGEMSVPLIGSVHAKGLTLAELRKTIEKKLSNGFLKSPSVTVQMAEYRPFYILGEVRSPGSYSFVSDMTVLNAVALAGGFTYRADKDEVEILRSNGTKSKPVNEISVGDLVQPGDIILVKERFF